MLVAVVLSDPQLECGNNPKTCPLFRVVHYVYVSLYICKCITRNIAKRRLVSLIPIIYRYHLP